MSPLDSDTAQEEDKNHLESHGDDNLEGSDQESGDQDDEEEVGLYLYLSEIREKEYIDRKVLKRELDAWSASKKFSLSFESRERKNQEGEKVSILKCKYRTRHNCPFYLEYRAQPGQNYTLKFHNRLHNHSLLEFNPAPHITETIPLRILSLWGVTKDPAALTRAIDAEFKLNFARQTIYNYGGGEVRGTLGNPTGDAFNFIGLLKNEANVKSGFYNAHIQDRKLRSCCFMSCRMKNVASLFSDVLMIDTSHKLNRFSLPFLDISAINSYGKTSIVFVGLLEDQKFPTFVWALNHFKNKISSTPKIILSAKMKLYQKVIFLIQVSCFFQTFKNKISFFQGKMEKKFRGIFGGQHKLAQFCPT